MARELNSIRETQKLLGHVSRATVYNLIASGKLQRVNLGSRALITGSSIDRLINELGRQPASGPVANRASH